MSERISIRKADGTGGMMVGVIDAAGVVTVNGAAILNGAALDRHGISRAEATKLNTAGNWSVLPADCIRRINEDVDGVLLVREADVAAKAAESIVGRTDIPANAIAAHKKYGTADRAWAAEDEHAAMLINQYYSTPYNGSNDPATKSDC